MCIAVPCKIIKFIDKEKNIALGDFLGVKREINVQLVENIHEGDYVIVHVGFAIQKLDIEDALESINAFDELDQIENLQY